MNKVSTVAGWRILCADCGSNTDLMGCYEECNCEELDRFCRHEKEIILCRECIDKRETPQDALESEV